MVALALSSHRWRALVGKVLPFPLRVSSGLSTRSVQAADPEQWHAQTVPVRLQLFMRFWRIVYAPCAVIMSIGGGLGAGSDACYDRGSTFSLFFF